MTATEQDIWGRTWRCDRISGLPSLEIVSAVSDFNGPRRLAARINLSASSFGAVRFDVAVNLTPAQMRALAKALETHAERIEHELMPLIAADPGPPPETLYQEPEAVL